MAPCITRDMDNVAAISNIAAATGYDPQPPGSNIKVLSNPRGRGDLLAFDLVVQFLEILL